MPEEKKSGLLVGSPTSLRIDQDDLGRATIPAVPIYALGGDEVEINDNVCEVTDEIHIVLSSTGYTGKSMKRFSDFLTLQNKLNEVWYTGIADENSKCKTIFRDIHK